jgi:hypothetical protein
LFVAEDVDYEPPTPAFAEGAEEDDDEQAEDMMPTAFDSLIRHSADVAGQDEQLKLLVRLCQASV